MTSPVPALPALHVPTAAELAQYATALNALLAEVRTGGAVKTSDTSRASTTTFADDPHLVLPVVAGGIYAVECDVNITIGAGGYKYQFSAPAGSTFENGSFAWNNQTVAFALSWQRLVSTGTPGAGVAGHAGGGAGGTPYRARTTLFVGGTGGNLAFQWAQDASNVANTTVVKGSWMRLTRFA